MFKSFWSISDRSNLRVIVFAMPSSFYSSLIDQTWITSAFLQLFKIILNCWMGFKITILKFSFKMHEGWLREWKPFFLASIFSYQIRECLPWEKITWVWVQNQFLSEKFLFQMGWFIELFIFALILNIFGVEPKFLLAWIQEEANIKAWSGFQVFSKIRKVVIETWRF